MPASLFTTGWVASCPRFNEVVKYRLVQIGSETQKLGSTALRHAAEPEGIVKKFLKKTDQILGDYPNLAKAGIEIITSRGGNNEG